MSPNPEQPAIKETPVEAFGIKAPGNIKPFVRHSQKFTKGGRMQYKDYIRMRNELRQKIEEANGIEWDEKETYMVIIKVWSRRAFNFDIDNVLKSVLDSSSGVLPDDRYCVDVVVRKKKSVVNKYEIIIVRGSMGNIGLQQFLEILAWGD